MSGRRRLPIAVAGATVLLAAMWLVAGAIGARPGYDAAWHLIWAQDLLAGRKPSFDVWAAPTEHPLMVAICLLAAPFGNGAGRMLIALELVALVTIVLPAMRLTAATLGSRAAGAVGLAILAGAYGLLLAALRGYLDVWFVLLVVWAAARISTGGRSGAGAWQLGAAGLLRPEGWLLAALAACASLVAGDRRGFRDNALAALIAPAIWFGIDWAVTGRPLLSIDTARTLSLEGDGGGAIDVLATSLLGGVRGPATVLGLIGLLLAWRLRGARSIGIPLAVGLTGLAVAVAIPLAGLTLLPRYLMLAWVSLSLFAGFAIAGWSSLASGSASRVRWRAIGVSAAAVGTVGAIALGAPSKLASEVAVDRSIGEDLATLIDDRAVRDSLECGPLTFPSFRLVPDAILELDSRSVEVRARALAPRPTLGVAILVTGDDGEVRGRYSRPGIDLPVDEEVPPGFRPIATAGDLTAFARCNPLSR